MKETGFVSLARRWWWFLALGAIVAGLFAYVGASRLTPTYEASVELLTGPINTDFGTLRAAGELARTYSELATSRRVLDATNRGLRLGRTREDLRLSITASANEVTRIVTVRVRDEDPERAAQIANRLARELASLSRRVPQQETEAIDVLMAQSEIVTLPEAVQERVRIAARAAFGQPLAGQLLVVDPADPPTVPVAPQKTLLTLLAAFTGMLLAGLIVLLREFPGRQLEGEQALTEIARVPILGSVNGGTTRGQELEVEAGPSTPGADAYRVLAAKMGFTGSERPIRTVVLIGSDQSIGSGPLAANLAAALSEAATVTLVDASAVEGEITKVLGLDGRPGYGELISSDANGDLPRRLDEFAIARNDRFDVIPSGTADGQPLFDPGRAREVLAGLASRSDFVVLAAPPVDRSPSSLVWAQVADATVLVVDGRKSTRQSVSEAVQSFSLVGANLIGTVWRDSSSRWTRILSR